MTRTRLGLGIQKKSLLCSILTPPLPKASPLTTRPSKDEIDLNQRGEFTPTHTNTWCNTAEFDMNTKSQERAVLVVILH